MAKIGRNSPCPCGSGKKFKKCHGLVVNNNDPSPRKYIENKRNFQNREWFWSEFARAMTDSERGGYLTARRILENLINHPRQRKFDPDNNVLYSYAIVLQQSARSRIDLRLSVEILQDLIKKTKISDTRSSGIILRSELASALGQLHQFDEAADVANEALRMAHPNDPVRSLAEQKLGFALFHKDDLDGAEAAYLRAVDAALDANRLESAGIGAEWLARIALRRSQYSISAAWLTLMRDVFRQFAPQHLVTARDILSEPLVIDAVPANLDALPLQATTLRNRIPMSGEIGEHAGIHLDSLQVDLGGLSKLANLANDEKITALFPIPEDCLEVADDLCVLLRSETNLIISHERSKEVLESLIKELWPSEVSRILARLGASDIGNWTVVSNEYGSPSLMWQSTGAGPIAFRVEIMTMILLYLAAYTDRKKKILEIRESFEETSLDISSSLQFINLADRSWPRPIHTWMIGNGQTAAGGEGGAPQLAEDKTRHRLNLSAENRSTFVMVGRSTEEAELMDKSGLIALLPTELMSSGGVPPTFVGTTPLNEINLANPPAYYPKLNEKHPYFVLDRHYNTWLSAPAPEDGDVAIYGKNNDLFRDHFSPFHKQVNIVGSVRSKHYAVPIVDVRTLDELKHIAQLLDSTAERLKPAKHVEPDARVWYRGQTRGYALERSELVSRFLFGITDVTEPSLLGAAPRRGWNYHQVHSFLSTALQGEIYSQAKRRAEHFEEIYTKWSNLAVVPGAWDLGVMGLAQHYGIPTLGIDITHDPLIALWFATNRCIKLDNGRWTYRPLALNDWDIPEAEWPVIYAILPVTHSLNWAIRDVNVLEPLGVEALRPLRQKGAFFMGATTLHQNRLAEALVCVMRLAPAIWNSGYDSRQLFPKKAEDPLYTWMLSLKKQYIHGDIGRFLDEIPEYEE